jgi:hypothetical protein
MPHDRNPNYDPDHIVFPRRDRTDKRSPRGREPALGGAVAAQAHTAFADGLHLALLVAAGIALTAAIAVGMLLRRRDRVEEAAASPA